MVKLTKKDKEKIQQVQEIEAQLRASAKAASQIVGSWLGDSDNDDEDDNKNDGDNKSTKNAAQQSEAATVKARDVFQGRPARLGVGAKFLSHKDMVRGNTGGDQLVSSAPSVLTADELRLKRRLTRGITPVSGDAGGDVRSKRTARQAADGNDDDNDDSDSGSESKSKAFANRASSSSTPPIPNSANSKPPLQSPDHNDTAPSETSFQPSKKRKKQKRSAALLDSLVQRRKR
ncbi:hypothetical protein H4217_001800 [Coemansia sp. RSA 1939]|nr:hypothetical protein H4217_001800 [Coemansia sp. RSA 1939]KAJ2615233.1 hypothetical protein EV177_001663 [Coemansia sp. RSA 1804]